MFADALPSWVNTTSARVNAGLGTIARVVASGEAIYRRKLASQRRSAGSDAAGSHIHDTIASLIAETRARFGHCLLIDCHSMPAHGRFGAWRRRPDFVLGDAHGTACAAHRPAWSSESLIDLGYRVSRNDPYAGGFVTRHYGRPREHVHALQIEIARDLYMDEARIERSCRASPPSSAI